MSTWRIHRTTHRRRTAMARWRVLAAAAITCLALAVQAQTAPTVADIPSRPGVTVRALLLAPAQPRAAVVLLAGGHGGLQLRPDGGITWGAGNFLVRSRQLFADQTLLVAVVDAPSDRQASPYLQGFRLSDEHVADMQAVIAWLRQQQPGLPVWLVGTSRGTQSAAYVATQLGGAQGPDGIVLTSSILRDRHSRPVPDMALDRLRIPVLVVHHEQDGCEHCYFADVPLLMNRLGSTPRHQLLALAGGNSQGPACEARAHHGYNGQEADVVAQIARWILSP